MPDRTGDAENERLRTENAELVEANQRLRRQYENLRALQPQLYREVKRLREGIREVVEGLDRADAYDTPLYERLTALLNQGQNDG